jgi:hypothetical protein
MATMTKQAKITMDAYRFNGTAESLIVSQLQTMYDAGQTDGQSDRFWRSHYLEVGFYNVTTWYFDTAESAQSWINFYSSTITQYDVATNIAAVIQDYNPNGNWQVNIVGPNAWNVHYTLPV